MTHFLGRLVERARGTAPRVKPIVAPRFAPAPMAEIATAIETSPPVRRELRAREAASDGTNGAVIRHEEPRTERPKEELIEKAMPAQPETLLVPVPRPDDDVMPHVPSAVAPPVVRRANHESRPTIARPSGRSGVSANSVTFPNESAANERPIVRVTIGRIEVRAAPAPAPMPREIPTRSEPKLTLDAYLKSRKEGAR